MGENCEIEIISKKLLSTSIINEFFDALGINYEFDECAKVISNWEYEGLHEIVSNDNDIAREVLLGNIVLLEGYASGNQRLGAMLCRNADGTFSNSIWYAQTIKAGHPASQMGISESQVNIFLPYGAFLVAIGIEIQFVYKDTIEKTMQSSSGVSQWYIKQGDGLLRQEGTDRGRQGDG